MCKIQILLLQWERVKQVIMLTTDKNKKEAKQQPLQNDTKPLTISLDDNVNMFKSILHSDDTIIYREIKNSNSNRFRSCLIYMDGMINVEKMNDNIIQPILDAEFPEHESDTIPEFLQYKVISANKIERCQDIDELLLSVFNGDSILLTDGYAEALIIKSKGFSVRAIVEPDYEKVLEGPREGFIEAIIPNLSMIRRKLKTSDLKFKFKKIGVRSNTKICICYLESLANDKILKELEYRLDKINIDGILDTGYIEELVMDSPLSPFKTVGGTERPDVVAAKLLEGRIAVVVDGTPVVLTVPFIYMEHFQTPEDYYINYFFASFNRMLRLISEFLTISAPAIYVALTTYHHEMLPTPLLLSIYAARQGVPFPTIVEIIILLFAFEVVRESSTRMPTGMGQSISIVGTLILGQAAVDANFFSAPVVIVTAITGISGLILTKLKGSHIIMRVILLFLATILGLYGYVLGIIGLFIQLFSMRSFGIPYMTNIGSLNASDLKDAGVRAPWWYMAYRPKLIGAKNAIRQSVLKTKRK